MAHVSFTRAEAQAKIGTQVLARVAGVSEGAMGTMTSADRVIGGNNVEVTWGKSGRRTPWVERLTKAEGEARLVELPSQGGSS
jgi:hypothetical protein